MRQNFSKHVYHCEEALWNINHFKHYGLINHINLFRINRNQKETRLRIKAQVAAGGGKIKLIRWETQIKVAAWLMTTQCDRLLVFQTSQSSFLLPPQAEIQWQPSEGNFSIFRVKLLCIQSWGGWSGCQQKQKAESSIYLWGSKKCKGVTKLSYSLS